MHSWDVLDAVPLKPDGDVSAAFLQAGALDYRAAARFVSLLRYGRNTDPTDPLIVMRERSGTCSTKHALLRRLAVEQGMNVALVVGIYGMHERNTPGIGRVLNRHGLVILPEAHCYLRFRGKRIDITRPINAVSAEPISHLLQEKDIAPEQIGDYKTALHREFLRQWIAEAGGRNGRSVDELWRIREECIEALSQQNGTAVTLTSPA